MTGRPAMTAEPDELVVFVGGPWNGWWLTRPRLEDSQQAARNLGYEGDLEDDDGVRPGVALGYKPTEAWRTNPEGYGEGREWRWSP